jgi:predicted metalloprotease with PDZ domain
MRTLALALLLLSGLVFGCASRPKASEADSLYYQHGGETLRRKRTETRHVTEKVWNKETRQYDQVSTTKTLTVLEIETSDGRIVDYEASLGLANELREGQPIPTISDERAAKAGLIGDCVEVTRVVSGGRADAAGVQEDDLIVKYDGQSVLGARKLRDLTAATKPADTVTLVVERDGKQQQLSVHGGDLGVEVEDYWR